MPPSRAVDLAFLCMLFLTRTLPAQASNVERQSSEPDNTISNGTCYYGPGQEADPSFIPCGNTAFGNFHCCEASANCLDHNACYADGTTYVAGCTDPTYQDPSCPNRGPYSSQQWSGLVYCNGTSDEWTLCDDSSANSNQVVYVPGCYCPEDAGSRNFAFSAPSLLANQVSLPASDGGAMSLFDGYTPPTVLATPPSTAAPTTSSSPSPAPSSTFISSPSASSTPSPSTPSPSTPSPSTPSPNTPSSSTPSSSTSSSSPSSSSYLSSSITTSSPTSLIASQSSQASSSGVSTVGAIQSTTTPTSSLSTGAKAGIGVGAAIGALLPIGLLGCLAICLRRRKRRSMLAENAIPPQAEVQPVPIPFPQRSPAWSTTKSELPGDGSTSSGLSPSIPQTWSRPLSEAEGSYPTYQSMASSGPSELAVGGGNRASYQPYRRAEVSPGAAGSSTASASQGSYKPGRQVDRGHYEMPAHLPGSTMM